MRVTRAALQRRLPAIGRNGSFATGAMQAERLRLPIADIAAVGDGTLMAYAAISAASFSHPISHRTPQYRVGNGGIGWLATCQKPLNFGTKRNCKRQDKMGRNGLGNRCSIRLSYGTVI
jgi:hypothetical protein